MRLPRPLPDNRAPPRSGRLGRCSFEALVAVVQHALVSSRSQSRMSASAARAAGVGHQRTALGIAAAARHPAHGLGQPFVALVLVGEDGHGAHRAAAAGGEALDRPPGESRP